MWRSTSSGSGSTATDALYLAFAAVAGTALVFTGVVWLLPLGQAALAFVVLVRDLRRGDLWGATRRMLLWAVFVSVCVIAVTLAFPAAAEKAIFRGAAYREEMFHYIRTGIGAEGSPRQFIPQHLSHYGLTLGLSLLTAGFAGLALGCVLLNYMNFYVGSLVIHGAHPWLGLFFGWPIWSYFRVTGFVLGSVAAAHLLLGRLLGLSPWKPGPAAKVALWSLGFFLADMVVKAFLAHPWRRILEKALLG